MSESASTVNLISLPGGRAEFDFSASHAIPLSGVRNFRDLGGYITEDGNMVRPMLLFRSANLHRLTPGDLRTVASLSLGLVIDFRSDSERERDPDSLPANPAPETVHIPILDTSTRVAEELEERIRGGRLAGIDPYALLMQTNRELASQFTPEYSRFVHEVLNRGSEPILFHCAAGKDRTGFAAAILLRILGVSAELVRYDYLLSNRYYYERLRPEIMRLAGTVGPRAARMVAGFVAARSAFLETAFQTIDRVYGSFEAYVDQGLHLGSRDIGILRQRYLKPAPRFVLEPTHVSLEELTHLGAVE